MAGAKAKPPIKYLVFCLFAGHGILKDGEQHLVLNELDKKQGFYKLLNAESYIRRFSEACNTNSYFIGIFACCRELFKPAKMQGQVEKG